MRRCTDALEDDGRDDVLRFSASPSMLSATPVAGLNGHRRNSVSEYREERICANKTQTSWPDVVVAAAASDQNLHTRGEKDNKHWMSKEVHECLI